MSGSLGIDSDQALAWRVGRDERARDQLRAWSGYQPLREQLAQILRDELVAAPSNHGGRWFHLRSDERQGTVLTVGDSALGPGRALIATHALMQDERPVSLDWLYPSPNGRYVAFGISFDGDEQSILHVVDVDTGRLGPERIPFTSLATVAWLPDSRSFYFNASLAPDWENADKQIFFHRVGEETPPQREALDVREAYTVFPQISPDGRWLAAVASEVEPRPHYLKDIGGGDWRPFLADVDGSCFGAFVGNRYVAVCTEGAPRGRVVAIPIETASDRSTWEELVPESDAVLRLLVRIGDRLVLCSLVDAASRLTVLSLDGRERQEIDLPGEGVVHASGGGWFDLATPAYDPRVVPAGNAFTFAFATHDRSPAVYRYEFAGRDLEQLRPPAVTRSDIVCVRAAARAPDGCEVVYRAYHRADLDRSTPQPTLLYGYGGWNYALVRGYLGIFMPVVDAGGIVVFAHLRGGGELGRDFWIDGRLRRKQHTFDDLYAVATELVSSGMTRQDRLAVTGASNGGLLTAVAVVQRPDLWCAAASLVPLCDMLEFTRDAYTAVCTVEYGDPVDAADAEVLRSYSPCHNVPERMAVPPTLIYCGANDMRCPAWHGQKLAQQLARANVADTPVLLRADAHGGHLDTRRDAANAAEWVGFLMDNLGLRPTHLTR